ncbi:MAG: hypothetical protein BWY02_02817 [bacterium ADurb.Bin157]|nr:MAG: hypothetical protein BWY02_02817 [bacterium ADurb.Bin157]
MSNHTQGKIKLNTGQFQAKYDINKIIAEAEANPPDEYWEFATDQAETLLFLKKQIQQEGKIKIEI